MGQIAAALFCVLLATSFAAAQSQPDNLTEFLRKYLGEPYPPFEQEQATQYSSAIVDLKDDGTKEFIVYITGRGWCGSGGCTMLILAPKGTSFRIITKTTTTRLPIRVLATKSNGWHDISCVVAGGGIQPGYEAVLSFDGKTYPRNPSVPPAHPVAGRVRGQMVLSETAKEKPVYLGRASTAGGMNALAATVPGVTLPGAVFVGTASGIGGTIAFGMDMQATYKIGCVQ